VPDSAAVLQDDGTVWDQASWVGALLARCWWTGSWIRRTQSQMAWRTAATCAGWAKHCRQIPNVAQLTSITNTLRQTNFILRNLKSVFTSHKLRQSGSWCISDDRERKRRIPGRIQQHTHQERAQKSTERHEMTDNRSLSNHETLVTKQRFNDFSHSMKTLRFCLAFVSTHRDNCIKPTRIRGTRRCPSHFSTTTTGSGCRRQGRHTQYRTAAGTRAVVRRATEAEQ